MSAVILLHYILAMGSLGNVVASTLDQATMASQVMASTHAGAEFFFFFFKAVN